MWIWFVVTFVCGAAVDRLVTWDKQRAVVGEREYHIDTIRSLEKQLQITKMDNFAMKRERGEAVDVRDYVYENPNFERDFARTGHAKTILRRRNVRRSAKKILPA